jgi:hypothetical protein
LTVFLTWPFAATGATTSRTLPDRLADVVNVKDFGATGDGVADDTAEIQAAIDAAFGTAGSPHGTDSHLNRPLKIPYGNYVISSPLIMTDVVGGVILGDGVDATLLSGATSILTVNGCENTHFSGFNTSCGGKSTSNGRHGIKLDAGTGAIGLSGVTLSDIGIGSSQYGLRIAPGGTGGQSIVLERLQSGETQYAIAIEGTNCQVTALGGVHYANDKAFWVKNGNLNCNTQFASGTAGAIDILHDSTGVTTVFGTRSESENFLKATAGTIIGVGILHQGAGAAVNCVSPAVVKVTSALFGSGGANGYITGSGDVFLRNVEFQNGEPIYMSSFSGRICECTTDNIFTFAQLPSAAEGLTLNLSNSGTATWGANITSTGANHVLARYNGSNWTVVGK